MVVAKLPSNVPVVKVAMKLVVVGYGGLNYFVADLILFPVESGIRNQQGAWRVSSSNFEL